MTFSKFVKVANHKQEEEALLSEMEVTGQAFEDMQVSLLYIFIIVFDIQSRAWSCKIFAVQP